MRDFEAVFIFQPDLSHGEISQYLTSLFHILYSTENSETAENIDWEARGGVEDVDHWGVRHLSYPINDHNTGYYVVVQFTADSARMPQFERALKLTDVIIRYLIVIQELVDVLPITIDPGTASPAEIGEFLAELSTLFRMVGGSGIEFRVDHTRSPAFIS